MHPHPFRFATATTGAESRAAWEDRARRAEALGFDAIFVPDHLAMGQFSPMVALASMAAVTTHLRLGTAVLNNDFRHPALLASEAATLDLLTDGRVELGIGAGHSGAEYTEIGLPFDPAGRRVDRFAESVRILRRLFDGQSVTFSGEHYRLRDHQLYPRRRPRLMVGGNGARVLTLGAQEADIVQFTGEGGVDAGGRQRPPQWGVDQVDAKVALVREAAGERFEDLELSINVRHLEITQDRRSVLEGVAPRFGLDGRWLLGSGTPYVLVGTVDEIVRQLHDARDRWGFSYFKLGISVGSMKPMAQIIDAIGERPAERTPAQRQIADDVDDDDQPGVRGVAVSFDNELLQDLDKVIVADGNRQTRAEFIIDAVTAAIAQHHN
jgi:probable F420-dependent oxidoreductase